MLASSKPSRSSFVVSATSKEPSGVDVAVSPSCTSVDSPVIKFVTSINPSIKVNESPVDGSDCIANSVPFTDATEVGVEILNSLPFWGLTFAATLPYLISRDLLILFPDRSPMIFKSELPSIFTTVLSSRYISAT